MRTAPGFTAIEMLVVIAILGIVAAVGYPGMSNWLLTRRVQSAAAYYMDGLALARNLAIEHNGSSRLVLSANATSGQSEWRIDMCFPTIETTCDDQNGAWSTVSTPPAYDPMNTGFKSVTQSGAGLPTTSTVQASLSPSGADAVYFTPTGWVNTAVTPRLTRIVLAPSYQNPTAFAPVAVALTLAGVASRCDPHAVAHDPKGCPP